MIEKEYNANGTLAYLKFNEQKLKKSLDEADKLLKDSLKISEGNSLKFFEKKKDDLGYEHHYYKQYYNGIKVEYGVYAVHSKNNIIEYINGNFKQITELNTIPKISKEQALDYALKFINAKKYLWENANEERFLKQLNQNDSLTYFPKGELVIISEVLKGEGNYRLAYKFDIFAEKPYSHKIYYIDAENGTILDSEELIKHANVIGVADTRYSGTQTITTDSYSGGYRLRQNRNGVSIQTLNMNSGTSYAGATDFTDNDNNWTSSEHNNPNYDNAALDAHWASEKVYDYFLNIHGRNSWNNSGGSILNYVHTNLVAMGYSDNGNAFWDGQRMVYGDGNYLFSPLTSLDVVAHELGHGITGSSVNLVYKGESGALNEGFSDIWAACVEAVASPNKLKWKIGEDISTIGTPLRAMDNPKTGGLLAQPNTYGGTNWVNTTGCTPNQNNDYCGVHTNSGVLNYWFYLVSEGGNGTNDKGDAYSIMGIGMTDASKIAYRTLTLTLTNPQATFSNARTATIQAAIDLFGNGSCQHINVVRAWYAVGVGTDYPWPFSITGSGTCGSGTYTVSNLPAGATVTWSLAGTTNLSLTPSGNSVTLTETGTVPERTDILIATISGASCGTFTLQTNVTHGVPNVSAGIGKIWGGGPQAWFFTIGGTIPQTPIRFDVQSTDGSLLAPFPPTGPASTSLTNVAGIYPYNYGSSNWVSNPLVLNVRARNTCGTSEWQTVYIDAYSSAMFIVYPNPASNELTVSYKEVETEEAKNTNSFASTPSKKTMPEFSVKLFDEKKKLLFSGNNKGSGESIKADIQHIPNGTYFLHIFQGKKVIKKQVIIRH